MRSQERTGGGAEAQERMGRGHAQPRELWNAPSSHTLLSTAHARTGFPGVHGGRDPQSCTVSGRLLATGAQSAPLARPDDRSAPNSWRRKNVAGGGGAGGAQDCAGCLPGMKRRGKYTGQARSVTRPHHTFVTSGGKHTNTDRCGGQTEKQRRVGCRAVERARCHPRPCICAGRRCLASATALQQKHTGGARWRPRPRSDENGRT
jgi:hypothetical protein